MTRQLGKSAPSPPLWDHTGQGQKDQRFGEISTGLPKWLSGKESAYQCRRRRDISSIPGSARSPGEGNGRESSWTEEPGGLQSIGSQRVGHDLSTHTHSARAHTMQCFLGSQKSCFQQSLTTNCHCECSRLEFATAWVCNIGESVSFLNLSHALPSLSDHRQSSYSDLEIPYHCSEFTPVTKTFLLPFEYTEPPALGPLHWLFPLPGICFPRYSFHSSYFIRKSIYSPFLK